MLDFLVNSIRLSFLWTSWFIKLELCELDEYCRWREKGRPWAWLWDSLQDSFQEAFPMGFTPVSHVYGGSVAHDHKLREWSQTHLPGRGHFRNCNEAEGPSHWNAAASFINSEDTKWPSCHFPISLSFSCLEECRSVALTVHPPTFSGSVLMLVPQQPHSIT